MKLKKKWYVKIVLFVFPVALSAIVHAQGLRPEPSVFEDMGRMRPGNSLLVGASTSTDKNSQSGKLGYQLDEYQLSFSHREIELNYSQFPKNLVQTHTSVGKMTILDSGNLLMLNLGAGVSAEKNSDTYNYVGPTGQVMYMVPPDENSNWGYMAGLMSMSNSPLGTFPIPMIMANYSPDEDFQLSLGLPMISAKLKVWEDAKLYATLAPFGIQRVALKQTFSEFFDASIVYKQDRSFFAHISGWDSSHLFNYKTSQLGIESEYKISSDVSLGLEGGYLIERNLQKVESGFNLNNSPLWESAYVGGSYVQILMSYQY